MNYDKCQDVPGQSENQTGFLSNLTETYYVSDEAWVRFFYLFIYLFLFLAWVVWRSSEPSFITMTILSVRIRNLSEHRNSSPAGYHWTMLRHSYEFCRACVRVCRKEKQRDVFKNRRILEKNEIPALFWTFFGGGLFLYYILLLFKGNNQLIIKINYV